MFPTTWRISRREERREDSHISIVHTSAPTGYVKENQDRLGHSQSLLGSLERVVTRAIGVIARTYLGFDGFYQHSDSGSKGGIIQSSAACREPRSVHSQ